jgi:hypothetical protein
MRKSIRQITILVIALLLAGCAATPKIALEPGARNSIKRIAIVETPEPEQYLMYPGQVPAGFVLYAFGAIGGAILGGIEANRVETASKSFTAAVSPFKPSMNSTFQSQLEAGLKAKGYEVARVVAPLKDADSKDYDLAKVDGKFDAFLIGTVGGGYSVDAGGVGPRLLASVNLVDRSGERKHFAQTYLYSVTKIGDFTHISPETRFIMSSPEAAYGNGKLAAEALKTGASRIADQVAAEF